MLLRATWPIPPTWGWLYSFNVLISAINRTRVYHLGWCFMCVCVQWLMLCTGSLSQQPRDWSADTKSSWEGVSMLHRYTTNCFHSPTVRIRRVVSIVCGGRWMNVCGGWKWVCKCVGGCHCHILPPLQFFSQKTILPSPWAAERQPRKHVTFSPHPPQTACKYVP